MRGPGGGILAGRPTGRLRELRGGSTAEPATVGRADQGDTSVVFGDRLIFKLYRRLHPGSNPDVEMGQLLTERGFPHTPTVAGWIEYRQQRGEPMAVGLLQGFVLNEGDVWSYTLDALGRYYDRAVARSEPAVVVGSTGASAILARSTQEPPEAAREAIGGYLETARLLGLRTAELHRALAGGAAAPDSASGATDDGFAPEPFTPHYRRSQYQGIRAQAAEAFALLRRRLDVLPESAAPAAAAALAVEESLRRRVAALLDGPMDAMRTRIHGDYHAGQTLWTGRDVIIIDFEGEPGRPLSERRHKHSPLRDVAGMLRSFHYAAYGPLLGAPGVGSVRPEDVPHLEPWARLWYGWVSAAFVGAYLEAMEGSGLLPEDRARLSTLLGVLLIQKATYELIHELTHRPEWVAIPLRGLVELATEDGGALAR